MPPVAQDQLIAKGPAGASSAAVLVSGALVLNADAAHTFQINTSQANIARVDIVDVDLVLTTRDGAKIILQGAALNAFSADGFKVVFLDGVAQLEALVQQVGEVKIDTVDRVAHSAPQRSPQQKNNNPQDDSDQTDKGDPAQPSQSRLTAPVEGQVGPAKPTPEHPIAEITPQHAFDTPPSRAAPPAPEVTSSSNLLVELLARTGTSLNNGLLLGSYGADGADTNAIAARQIAPQVIVSPSQGLIVQANALGGQSFIKILHVTFSGAGNAYSLSLQGVPAGYTIEGATPNAQGVYELDLARYRVGTTGNAFNVPIQFSLADPNAAQPIHDTFTLQVAMGVSGSGPATIYKNPYTVVVHDAKTANDISTAQTGNNVLVLPAQGIGYQITAAGHDTITGGRNDDTIYGAGGENVFDGALGDNTLDYTKAGGAETIDAGAGMATGAQGVDTISNFDRFVGGTVDSLLIGNAKTVFLASGGEATNDVFRTGGGGTTLAPETIQGSARGVNTVSYVDATRGVSVNLQTGVATGFGVQQLSNIQILIGSAHDDTLTGSTTTQKIAAGGPNSNSLFDPGGGGTFAAVESIIGSAAGINTLTYSGSNAAVNVSLITGLATGYGVQHVSHIQSLIGSRFSDFLTGSSTAIALSGGAGGNDTFDGGGGGTDGAPESISGSSSGNNTLTFVNAPGGVSVNLTVGLVTGAYGVETINAIQNIIGSGFNDFLVGSNSTRSMSGGRGGDDTFDGGGGGTLIAPESLIGSSTGLNTVTYAQATSGVTVDLQANTAVGYGVQSLANIRAVIGSAFSDSMKGSVNTTILTGGGGGNDTFDAGGGGTAQAPETILGSLTGSSTLTYVNDTIGSLIANLTTGVIDAGGAHGYGFQTVASIQRLIGSAQGNDFLTGGKSTIYLAAGSSSASDTFDGGGGGTKSAPESIVGSANGINTLTFARYATGSISARLTTGVIDAGGTTGYGYLVISQIQRLIGTAFGGDFLQGAKGVIFIGAGSDTASDTFDGGGAGTQFAPVTITGSTGGTNTLTFAEDTAPGGGVNVNLATGVVSGGYGFQQVANIHRLIGSAVGADTITGDNSGDFIQAGDGATSITTGSGVNTIIGGAGRDTINARLGDNLIDGGGGDASIISGTGNNTLTFVRAHGPVQVDLIAGTATGYGVETIIGSVANLIGSTFNDYLRGSPATRTLRAGGPLSNDTFDGGGGGTSLAPQVITGSSQGVNTLTYALDPVGAIKANLSTGVIDAGGSSGYGYAQVYNIQKLIGSATGGDTLIGGVSTLYLGAGGANASDTFDGGGGGTSARAETIMGSASGLNTLSFANDTLDASAGSVNVNLSSGLVSGGYGYLRVYNIHTVIGSAYGADTIIGNDAGNILKAGGGPTLLVAGSGANTLIGGLGRDTIDASVGANLIDGGGGNASIVGGSGADTLTYENATTPVSLNLRTGRESGYGAQTITGAIAAVIGSALSDSIVGSSSTLSILGGSGGDDTLDSGGGGTSLKPETVVGGTGGVNTLTFSNDTTGSIVANMITGVINAGGATGYGYVTASQIQRLIGSAFGGDYLRGGPGLIYIGAGSSNASDTFDGGGAGTQIAPITIVGSIGGINTLTFANDTAPSGGVTVDLAAGTVAGGYGFENISNIHRVIGSAAGADTIVGDNSGDFIQAGAGATLITTGTGSNTIIGGFGRDTINALLGSNLIDGGGGDASIISGSGANTLTFARATGPVQVDLRAGTATGYGTETITGTVANLIGSSYDDYLRGSTATRTLTAGGPLSNDTFDGGGGGTSLAPQVITGSAHGVNTLTFERDPVGGVKANLSTGVIDAGGSAGYGYALVFNVQKLIGSAVGGDTLTGGLSTLFLGAGGVNASDTFDGGGGGTVSKPETIQGGAGGVSTLSFATDTLSASLGSVNVSLSTGVASGFGYYVFSNIRNVIGSAHGADTLTGDDNGNVLQAGGGATLIVAGRGANTLIGGLGSDTLNAALGRNVIDGGGGDASIIGGSGFDTLTYAPATSGVSVNLNSGRVNGYGHQTVSGAIQAVIGSSHSDTIVGSASTLKLDGGAGGDDTFDISGAGTSLASVTVSGGVGGINTLSFAADTVSAVSADLTQGFVDAGGPSGYGYARVTNIQRLIGSAVGGDVLKGGPSVLYLAVGSEQAIDTFDGGGGGTQSAPETIVGGTLAASTLTFAGDTSPGGGVNVNLSTGTAIGGYGIERLINIHRVIGSAAGADTIVGDAFNDFIMAGNGATQITTGPGSGVGYSTITGGLGRDTIVAVVGANLIDGGGGDASIIGGSGADTLTYDKANGPVIVDLINQTASGYGSQTITGAINAIIGSNYDDTLTGSSATTLIEGNGGNDRIDPGGGGAPTSLETIRGGLNNLTIVSYASAHGGVTVNLETGLASGSGYQALVNVVAVIGSNYSDSLVGSLTAKSLDGGGGGDDTFESGGGGTQAAAETITGSATGTNTLTFARDTVHSVLANLASGVVDAGGAAGYGYVQANNIQQLIGSAIGGDSLTGSAATVFIGAGSANATDTFDGGGGGTAFLPETIQGSANGNNVLTFANDSVQAVNANLSTGVVDGGGASGYGYAFVSHIRQLYGSAIGGDTLVGSTSTTLLSAANSQHGDLFDPGGGGTSLSPISIVGSSAAGAINILSYANDQGGGVAADLVAGTVNAGAYGYAVVQNIQQLVGSVGGGDFLRGSPITTKISAASSTASDTFDGGGGGTALAPETIQGSAFGANFLSFARDTLAAGGALIDLSNGFASATNYGNLRIFNIHGVIGTASGNDTIIGDDFNDTLKAGAGSSNITAGKGHNLISGGGGTGVVTINAALGFNLIDGGGGAASIIGGSGADTLTYVHAAGPVVVNLLQGAAAGYGPQTISGAISAIIGSTFDDTLTGSASTTSLASGGNSNNVVFDGGGGGTAAAPESILGSQYGINTLTFASDSSSGVTVDLAARSATGFGFLTFTNITRVIGSGSNDTLIGTTTTTSLSGGAGGSDLFDGGGGGTAARQETITGSATGVNTLTFARDTIAGVTANLQNGVIDAHGATGYGYLSVSNIQRLIGSAIGGDVLTGAGTTLYLAAGSSTASDTFDAGGGGSLATPESIIGSSGGVNTLTYANDTVSSIFADLSNSTVNSGLYGYQYVNNIQKLVGSAVGHDTLVGAANTLLLQAGSAINGDTFDGGGGGTSTTAESIVGSVSGVNTLTFAGDTVVGVNADLSTGIVDANGAGGYGYEVVSNIQVLVGSARTDTLKGSTTTQSISGGAGGDDIIDPGGGGTGATPETIAGSLTGINTLTFASDTTTPVSANLRLGVVNAGGATGYGYLTVSLIQKLIGSSQSDSLIGSGSTLLLSGGAGGNDTFDAGGGGANVAPLTITGGTGGVNTLDYSNDTFGSVNADLTTGVIDAGGALKYGNQQASNIQRLIGSAAGGDTLKAGAGVIFLSAGSAAAADTFDGGGVGTSLAPLTIVGSSGGGGTITFASDTIAGSLGGVIVNLANSSVSGAYGVEVISNIHSVIGSAAGNDSITGDTSNDTIQAGSGAVTIVSGTGNNSLIAGGGGDFINASAGANTIVAGGGTLTLQTSGNANTLSFVNAGNGVNVALTAGGGTITGYGSVVLAGALQGVIGTGYNDTLTGSSTTKYLSGGTGGNDTFDSGGGTGVTLIGSSTGANLVTFARDTVTSGGVTVNLGGGAFSGTYGSGTITNIHNVIGSAAGADSIYGDSFPDSLVAGGGANILIQSGAGTGNTLIGGVGRTTINAATGSSLILLGGGVTSVVGSSGGGNDTVSFANDTTSGVSVNLLTHLFTGFGGGTIAGAIQSLIGTTFNDSLVGSASTTNIQGVGGSDTFDGGGGGSNVAAESLVGSNGGVNFVSFANDTSAAGGASVDLTLGTASATNYGVLALTNIHNVIGSAFGADTIKGDSTGNIIIAGAGATSIQAGSGTNAITGGAGQDTINAAAGTNTILLGGGNTSVIGGSGADTLSFANDTTTGVTVDLILGTATGYGVSTVTGSLQGLIGSTGSDSLRGSSTTTYLSGGAGGSDTLDGAGAGISGAAATIIGGVGGVNTFTLAADTIAAVNANLQTNVVDAGGAGGYGYYALTNIQKLIGSAVGGDTLTGGTTTLFLGAGSDTASDTFDGGGGGTSGVYETITGSLNGNNTLQFAGDTATGAAGGMSINLATGVVKGVTTGFYGYEQVSNIHNVIGSASGNDVFVLETTHADSIRAGGGAVSVLTGTTGNTIVAGAGFDTITSTPGRDLIYAGGGSLSLILPNTGNADTLSFANATAAVIATLSATSGTASGYSTGGPVTATITGVLQNLVGSQFSDSLTGSATTLSLNGGAGGNDTFDGGGGGTALAPETITGASTGVNLITFAHDTVGGVNVNLLNGAVSGTYGYEQLSNIHNVIGSATGADRIVADNSGDQITLGAGASSVTGGSGGDTIRGGIGNDTIMGGSGSDSIVAGAGHVTIVGGAGNDTIDATLATAGSISGGAGRSAANADLITVGNTFAQSMLTGASSVDGGAGNNTLKLNWNVNHVNSFDFATIYNQIHNITTIDVSANSSAGAVTYTLNSTEINSMNSNHSIYIKLASNDILNISLQANEQLSLGSGGAEYITNSTTHAIISTIHTI